jgi:hypothetical protein
MDDLDRILQDDTTIAPSPRFAASVMAEVRAVVRDAPPEFPWRLFVLRLAWSGAVAAAGAALVSQVDMSALQSVTLASAPVTAGLAYATGAVFATFILLRVQRLLGEQE